jgi:steroid 5-alpha reductase family enzyme
MEISLLFPIFKTCFLIQSCFYLVSAPFKTEKLFDISGSLTFIACLLQSFLSSTTLTTTSFSKVLSLQSNRSILATLCVFLWTLRLGCYLLFRVVKHGKDSRFDQVKNKPFRFYGYWCMQAIWVFITGFPVYFINLHPKEQLSELGWMDYIGLSLWVLGFLIESLADLQKITWQESIGPDGRRKAFMHTGLWAYCRHPNYLGEILLWFGLWLLTSSAFRHTEKAFLMSFLFFLSPLFVTFLLLNVSGIPLLEKSSDKHFGHLKSYQAYKKRVPVLIPRLKSFFKSE